jgi:glycosyltransferase involved in cell wall biosynthesis
MRILIITSYPFPYGLAQTNRLIAMARGLSHAGAEVEVVVSKATEWGSPRNTQAAGHYREIKFTYTAGTTVRPKRPWARAVLYCRGLQGMLLHVIREHREHGVDALFMGVYGNSITWLVYLFTRFLGIRYLQERSEYPFLSYKEGLTGRIKLGTYLKCICPRFDGFIVISRALQDYFRPYLGAHTRTFLLPILVESDRFRQGDVPVRDMITYCGSMEGTKDGVPILIEAFYRIAQRFPETNLRLIGETGFSGFGKLKEKISELGLQERIEFTGRVERDEMPELLRQSRVLALARPASRQAEGGFPTKLGEYLASGRPVVVTAVGDIPHYLVHREHALLARPGDVEDFAGKLAEVLSDRPAGEAMAAKGRKLADEVFDYRIQGRKLYDWLQSLMEQ